MADESPWKEVIEDLERIEQLFMEMNVRVTMTPSMQYEIDRLAFMLERDNPERFSTQDLGRLLMQIRLITQEELA